jgi:hypothetical protein
MQKRRKPHLIRGREINPDGSFTIKTMRADELKSPPTPQHEKLTDGQAARAAAQWHRIGRIARPGIGEAAWVDQFRYDLHVDSELDKWDHIANVFDRAGGNVLSGKQRLETLRAIVMISTNTVDVESQVELPEKAVARFRKLFEETAPPRSGWHPNVPHEALHVIDVMKAMEGKWNERSEPIIDAIRAAEVVLLYNARTGNPVVLFGKDVLERIANNKTSEEVAVVKVAVDFETDEPEFVSATVGIIKELPEPPRW